MSLLALSVAWYRFVHTPQQTQAEFEALIQDAKPLLKRRKKLTGLDVASSISSLLSLQKNTDTAEAVTETLSEHSHSDISAQEAHIISDFKNYKSNLHALEQRFEALNYAHLSPCQVNDAYRNWGALRLWQSWAENRTGFDSQFKNKIAEYESLSAEYTGRPVKFRDIKAIGNTEYLSVRAELEILAKKVQAEFNQDLDSFAVRPENFSTSDNAIIARTAPLLQEIEAEFERLGDFSFASVPAGQIQTQQGYGPRYAIASYNESKNAMRLYWAFGRYNHIYDTMLIIHEIMPGHHLHKKMKKTKVCGIGPVASRIPFLEGWATYAEMLAEDRGFFDAPLQRLGWLDYRLVRSMRIILDTARIENDMTEEGAWALWQEKMPKRLNDDFPREWARINSSPHHLSYILGSQTIHSSREALREKYGKDFNEKEFHEALLNSPHQSLMFLSERIDAQMRARKAIHISQITAEEPAL